MAARSVTKLSRPRAASRSSAASLPRSTPRPSDFSIRARGSRRADPLYLDLVVATFTEGGVSTTDWRDSLGEFHRARRSILDLRGRASANEYANTARQYAAMTAYRGVWAKVAGR